MTQITETSYGVGQYRTSEAHWLIVGRGVLRNGTRRGIVFCHGATGNASSWRAADNADKVRALAAAGYLVISADISAAAYGGANWGNADHIDAIGDAVTYLRSTFGASASPVGVFGSSMGACGALAYAKANLADVFAVAGQIPVLDVDDIYQNNKGGFRASIGTAYGVTYPTSLGDLSDHEAVSFSAPDLAGLPVHLWCASNDSVASTTATATAWDGAGSTKTVTNLGAVGHDAGTVDAQQVVQFFDDNGGRT